MPPFVAATPRLLRRQLFLFEICCPVTSRCRPASGWTHLASYPPARTLAKGNGGAVALSSGGNATLIAQIVYAIPAVFIWIRQGVMLSYQCFLTAGRSPANLSPKPSPAQNSILGFCPHPCIVTNDNAMHGFNPSSPAWSQRGNAALCPRRRARTGGLSYLTSLSIQS